MPFRLGKNNTFNAMVQTHQLFLHFSSSAQSPLLTVLAKLSGRVSDLRHACAEPSAAERRLEN